MSSEQTSSAPVKILSLDGGGIRGLSSLLILEHIMERIRDVEGLAEVPRPCDHFDMIGGTSTGGIIAIMLGRLRMTVNECIRAYRDMAERAFTLKWTTFFPASPSGAFSAKALEAAMRDTVKGFCPEKECMDQRANRNSTLSTCTHHEAEFRDPSCTPTVVLAITKDNTDARPTLFTTGYDFFKPICVGRDNIKFIDSALGHNNPCEVLIEEANRRFKGRTRMQILSIGTGLGGIIDVGDTRVKVIKALKKMATSSMAVASRLDDRFGESGQYTRFNVEKGLEGTVLSDWDKASQISAHTQNYLKDNKRAIHKFVDAFLGRGQQAENAEDGRTALVSGPCSRKPCRYLPLPENENFVGRTSVMNTIRKQLIGDDDQLHTRCSRVAVVGLGGVGKTQIALQMARWTMQNKPDWHIFWVPAVSLASFERAYSEIARELGQVGTGNKDVKMLLRRYLESDACGRWLLIVDNADDENLMGSGTEAIRDFLPRTGRGRILFTTRTRKVASQVAGSKVVDLLKMDKDDAKELLEKSLVEKPLLKDEGLVAELLETLTFLPLAIVQAAAYLNETRTSLSEYIRLLHCSQNDMIELLETEFADDTRYRGAHNAVARTWVVSFEQIRVDPDAAMLLSFIAHVESRAIPRSMLPPVGSEQKMTHAIGVLCGYFFLNVREDEATYDMHRLVHLASQVWVRRQDNAVKQRLHALDRLGDILSPPRWERRETWRPVLPMP
ncbi:unnamed protein product [Parascedosporium putredinis]|uniref:PNPLA domain-containing protein n=1 Tax=Parascedosporium putredinis TaxID=1442378 RepID=A0A9P1MB22_9PEZI|nr:unnamed protein product [Parascedosporium putredinis]CAI7993775.1 unnamed protein product [Parascedosporium putredinis]